MNVMAVQPPKASAAWPEGSPPRSGVPRPVSAFAAITMRIMRTSAISVRLLGRVAQPLDEPGARLREPVGEDEVADRRPR